MKNPSTLLPALGLALAAAPVFALAPTQTPGLDPLTENFAANAALTPSAVSCPNEQDPSVGIAHVQAQAGEFYVDVPNKSVRLPTGGWIALADKENPVVVGYRKVCKAPPAAMSARGFSTMSVEGDAPVGSAGLLGASGGGPTNPPGSTTSPKPRTLFSSTGGPGLGTVPSGQTTTLGGGSPTVAGGPGTTIPPELLGSRMAGAMGDGGPGPSGRTLAFAPNAGRDASGFAPVGAGAAPTDTNIGDLSYGHARTAAVRFVRTSDAAKSVVMGQNTNPTQNPDALARDTSVPVPWA